MITSGLVNWWTMDSDGTGFAIDVIGGQNLANQNHVPVVSAGVITNWFDFSAPVLTVWCESAGTTGITGSSARTSMLWFHTTTTGQQMEIFGYGKGGSNQRWGMYWDQTVTPTVIYLELVGAAVGFNFTNDGKNHHLAYSYSGGALSTSNPVMYLDGVAQTTTVSTAGTPATVDQNIAIAIVPGANVDQFFGQVDDVRLYNRALSGSEILSIYNNGKNGCP